MTEQSVAPEPRAARVRNQRRSPRPGERRRLPDLTITMIDPITGLQTHRDFPAQLGHCRDLAILVDVDAMIWLNDQFGLEAGDRALARLRGCSQPGLPILTERWSFELEGMSFLSFCRK